MPLRTFDIVPPYLICFQNLSRGKSDGLKSWESLKTEFLIEETNRTFKGGQIDFCSRYDGHIFFVTLGKKDGAQEIMRVHFTNACNSSQPFIKLLSIYVWF